MKAKRITILRATVAVATIAGAGAVPAAHHRRASSATPLTTDGTATQPPNLFQAQGVLQPRQTSWNGHADQGAGTEAGEHAA